VEGINNHRRAVPFIAWGKVFHHGAADEERQGKKEKVVGKLAGQGNAVVQRL
jgi:hypothetical protein